MCGEREAEPSPPRPPRLHTVVERHGFVFCTACCYYGKRRHVKLQEACPGRAEEPDRAERERRSRVQKISEGRHPTTGKPLPSAQLTDSAGGRR